MPFIYLFKLFFKFYTVIAFINVKRRRDFNIKKVKLKLTFRFIIAYLISKKIFKICKCFNL